MKAAEREAALNAAIARHPAGKKLGASEPVKAAAVAGAAPYGQTETGALYAAHAQGRAIAPTDITVGMTISVDPKAAPISVHRVEHGEYYVYVWDGAGNVRAVYPDAWCALVVAA